MSSSSAVPITIHRATPEDIEPILDLLTEYGLPRSYFEPFYPVRCFLGGNSDDAFGYAGYWKFRNWWC
jgi:hypothetical protein